MRSRLSAHLLLVTLTGFASSAVLAEECELTAEQSGFLAENNVELAVPEGEVPTIYRCDTNGDEMVDILDIRNIAQGQARAIDRCVDLAQQRLNVP